MNAFIKVGLFVLALIFFAAELSAQIVMVEDHRLQPDSSKWQGNVHFNFYNTRNINRIFTLSTASDIQFTTGRHKILSTNQFRLIVNIDSDGGSDENRGYQHLRYNYQLNKMFTLEAFTQIQTDQVLRIGTRLLMGGGGRVTFFEEEEGFFHAGLTYMYEFEDELDNEIFHRHHRMSTYVSVRRAFNEKVNLAMVGYYQPRFDQFSDYRISSGLDLGITIATRFIFSFSVDVTYDSSPVQSEEIDNLTYSISNGLNFTF